jgi:hypothetical protein
VDFDFQNKTIVNTIGHYEILLKELKEFFYKPICNNVFKIEPVLNKIINLKWEPKETDGDLSEANPFVDNIFQEICEKYDKLYLLSGGSLTIKSQMRFLDVVIIYINERILDTLGKIKKVIIIYDLSATQLEGV